MTGIHVSGKVKDSSSSRAFQKTWYQIPYFVPSVVHHSFITSSFIIHDSAVVIVIT